MDIEISHITKHFGAFRALDDVTLSIRHGELVALLGPSGSGKTTLLRIIAGLEYADRGTITFDGVDATATTVKERQVGFVFQHYALFRHMNVFDNVAFGLDVKPKENRPSKDEIRDRVMELLRLVGLDGLAHRYPSQLSGGQRQRVALARALAVEPSVLLLDEPFGALDANVRYELRRWMRSLHEEIGVTSVFVTHDQEEALELADRVAVFNEGRIEQAGTPEEVYVTPATPFVYKFMGRVNLFHGRVDEGNAVIVDEAEESGMVAVRSHQFEVSREPQNGGFFPATVKKVGRLGPLVRIEFVTSWGKTFDVELADSDEIATSIAIGDALYLRPKDFRAM
ncbi:MAG: sulfate/molybdate ABC transporter ATP-binding protein [Thermoanaerobaculia bacterium]